MRPKAWMFAIHLGFFCAAAGAALGAHVLAAGQAQSMARKSPVMEPVPALTPWADAHAHFDEKDVAGGIRSALAARGRENTPMIFLLMSPDTFDHPGHYEAEIILPEAKKYPGKIAVVGGGGSLNAMIIQSAATGDAGPAVLTKFKERAEQLLREGVAGFGEMTAEHFDGNTPYQHAPADHPLFLLLADIAAEHGVPIDLHMEAVPQDIPLPAGLKSPPNPPRLHANIAAFERLLAHNPRAKIIWAHAGFDNTGSRTPELNRRLLAAHPNLYMELKADPLAKGPNYPLDADGKIKADWLALIQEYPDRFVIGSDQHYPEPKDPVQRWQEVVLLLNQLPAGIREKIGTRNIAHIYGKSAGAAFHAANN
ncbi:MAG: amidohydrolase [Acidobacteriia bacterium]|nr:amidohydrolase [Terriglobia bacterium]